jgi:hypothetical protein
MSQPIDKQEEIANATAIEHFLLRFKMQATLGKSQFEEKWKSFTVDLRKVQLRD